MDKTCSVSGCDGTVRARGWCNKHYLRYRYTGDPEGTRPLGRPRLDRSNRPKGWVKDDNGQWWYYDARQRNAGEERICQMCGKTFPFKTIMAKHQPGLYCSRSCANKADKPGRREARAGAGRYLNSQGYIQVQIERGRYQGEHRAVMERYLDRQLLSEETVHHRNGQRDDNRLENLELWSSRHPKGQRVEDLLTFAREIIDLYG